MVAQFPNDPVNAIVDASLIPKVKFSIVTQDLSSASLDEAETKKARIAEIKIESTNIEKRLIVPSMTRLFDHIYNTIANDINVGITIVNTLQSGESSLLNSASVSISLNVNKINVPSTVDFSLEISNLKSEYIDDTFSRIKNYLLNAIETDMNPN
jgi:hypothetical protein